ncbi:MAG: nitrous oxide reductase family maturation protein NosD [Deltaproteobacteria bacterium]|nr:nitrous oxide reductase family maturation protein NosD [Deltaproteobacteria bacterium]
MAPAAAGAWGASWEPSQRPAGPADPSLPWFQKLVDDAPAGSVLKPPPGRYSGPVLMQKVLTIEGAGVTIDGGGKGTVFVADVSGATLRGLTFTGSGDSHSTDDACLNLRGNGNTLQENVFEDCLFGIDLKQANRNAVVGNRIRSKRVPLGLRGDAIRLWYSKDNRVEGNVVTDSRDVVVWYSDGNIIKGNTGTGSRYSLHFMFAQHNVVVDNRYDNNSVGIYVMYTQGVEIRNNVISRSAGPTGMGIGFKEASSSVVSGNTLIYCAVGISSDLSPDEPDTTIEISDNRIAYNGVGLSIVGNKTGTVIMRNVFEGNIDQVSQSGGGSAMHNTWKGNYWDDYQGFDRNRDDVGDTPYELYAYTDRIWMEMPVARFFKNAPLMEAIDFLERLAPFSTPDLLVKDEQPLFVRPHGGHP